MGLCRKCVHVSPGKGEHDEGPPGVYISSKALSGFHCQESPHARAARCACMNVGSIVYIVLLIRWYAREVPNESQSGQSEPPKHGKCRNSGAEEAHDSLNINYQKNCCKKHNLLEMS
eukprot:6072410-Amphidinium_carterae.1